MKKLLSTLLVMAVLVSSIVVQASAALTQSTFIPEDYAYLDLATASDDLVPLILEAREAIIYSQAWTVDGACVIVRADGTIKNLPEFYDLFPGWDIPVLSDSTKAAKVPAAITRAVLFNGNVYITTPPSNTASTPFYYINSSGRDVTTVASTIPGSSYNLGYSDSAGNSIGWAGYLAAGYGLKLVNPTSGNTYSVRASTYSTSGNASITVSD